MFTVAAGVCEAAEFPGCRFFTGDDSIADHYLEGGVVEDCVINSSCNRVRLIGPARRLSFSKCEFYGPGKFEHRTSGRTNMLAALCLQPSAWGRHPGPLEDVSARDLTMRDVSCGFHVVIRAGRGRPATPIAGRAAGGPPGRRAPRRSVPDRSGHLFAV